MFNGSTYVHNYLTNPLEQAYLAFDQYMETRQIHTTYLLCPSKKRWR